MSTQTNGRPQTVHPWLWEELAHDFDQICRAAKPLDAYWFAYDGCEGPAWFRRGARGSTGSVRPNTRQELKSTMRDPDPELPPRDPDREPPEPPIPGPNPDEPGPIVPLVEPEIPRLERL